MCRSQALSIKPLLVSAMFQVDPDVGFLSAVAHKLAMDLVGAGPWMFHGSKYSDTAGPVRQIVQRGAGCLDLGWLTVETERLVWAGAGRGMFHVEPDGLVDTPQQGGRMFHVEQRRAAPGEPLSDRTADGQRFRGREVGAAPESGYHQG